MKQYNGMVPPCGIFCGTCPNYLREKNPCLGAEQHCVVRRCKGIYVCCKEKKDLNFCYECKSFPCSRYKKFSSTWLKIGQDLIANQSELKEIGSKKWLEKMNKNS